MSENRNYQQGYKKSYIASMVLLLALLVRNAISTGAAQWVFLGVVAVAIISCSARVVANIHAEHSGATKDTTTVCDIRAGCKR